MPRVFPSADALNEAVRSLSTVAGEAGIRAAVLGGYAMQYYGSPRMTYDVDFVAERTLDANVKQLGPLSFGGQKLVSANNVNTDWIVRRDSFAGLYEDALKHCKPTEGGWCVITPEHLAAIKQSAGRDKDITDLLWLLQAEHDDGGPLVDRAKARALVGKFLGGQYAQQSFDSIAMEADWKKKMGGGNFEEAE